MPAATRIRFDDVEIDIDARELRRDGDVQHLEPQAFDLLLTLVRERQRVVSKEDLLDDVWGDQFVSESALTTRIKEIRRAVGDDGTRQAVVKNIRGRGYRFVAELIDDARAHRASTVPRHRGSQLIGRDELCDRAHSLLAAAPVLTLVGPGGVGKTTIADALAAEFGTTPDGAIVVALAPIDDPDGVVPAVRSAAGLTGAVTDDDVAITLAGLDGLLVLDNCEHVLDPVADLLERIVAAGGPLSVVATSRERLGVTGEQVLPIDVLSATAARELFVERARAAQPDYQVREEDEETLAEILDLLDHLPLAVEMAAARVSSIGLRDLRDLIAAEHSVLDSPKRTVATRHRTLGELVRWSERLLDEDGRRTVIDFSVFAGPVGADDVVGVLGRDDRASTMASVSKLVDRSLVVADTSGDRATYRMLATIRGYAARARPPDTDRRHAEWFTEVAEEADRMLRSTDEATGDARLASITGELRAAHRWARQEDPPLAARLTTALDLYGHSRHWTEPAGWAATLEPALDGHRPVVDGVWAALAAEAAHVGDYDRATELAGRVAGDDTGDPRVRASALETLADVAMYQGDLPGSIALSRTHADVAHEHGDQRAFVVGRVGWALGIAYGGDSAGGLELLGQLEPDELPPTGRAWRAYAEGECLASIDSERALDAYQRAIDEGAPVNSRFVTGVATVSRLALQARVGEPDEALTDYLPVLVDYRRTGDVSHSVTAVRNLVHLLVRTGDDEIAMRLLGALSGDAVKLTYGEESERLASARAAVEARRGGDVTGEWIDATAGRDHRWALDAAIDYLGERSRR